MSASDGRQAMLDRIRQALVSANLPDVVDRLPPDEPQGSVPSTSELEAQFTSALEAVDGQVIHAGSYDEARRHVLELISRSGGAVLAWPDSELPLPMASTLSEAGIDQVLINLSGNPDSRKSQAEALERPRVGLTGALAGLADTGSLALLSGPQRPMAASLLPETHIALLARQDLVADMRTFLTRFDITESTTTSRNLVFVTGPSRTADIEMTLTRGVHGPKHVIVVLVGDNRVAG